MRRQIFRSLTAFGLLLALATPAFAAQPHAAAAQRPAPGVWEELGVYLRLVVWAKTGWVGREGEAAARGVRPASSLKWGPLVDPDGLTKPMTNTPANADWGPGADPDGLSSH